MTLHLCLIAQAATAATRNATFPAGEPLLVSAETGPVVPDRFGRWSGADVRISPMPAAQETAARLGLHGVLDPDLADLDCGRWAGCAIADVARLEPASLSVWMAAPAFNGHGGESLQELSARMTGWLQASAEQKGRIVAVTHASVIRAIVQHILHAPAAAFWCLDAGPLTMTELRHDGRRWALRGFAMPI